MFALFYVFLWPRAYLTADLVLFASIPGAIGLALFGLTFWQKARVQIGRLQLKYKTIRQVAGLTAVICLLVPITQQTSIILENHYRKEVLSEWAQYHRARKAQYQFVVALTRLVGDPKDQFSGQLLDALSQMDPHFRINAKLVDRTIRASGEALDVANEAGASVVVWGTASYERSSVNARQIYITDYAGGSPFAGVYSPADFRLPNLDGGDLDSVLQLVVAVQSSEELDRRMHDEELGHELQPLIARVEAIQRDSKKFSNLDHDSRARLDFVIGVATRTASWRGGKTDPYAEAASYFRSALTLWTRESDALEWAMAQTNLGYTEELSSEQASNLGGLRQALSAYDGSLSVYRARSDRADIAALQWRRGVTLEAIASIEGNPQTRRQAIEAFHAAIASFDPNQYPISWATAQVSLAESLVLLADQVGDLSLYKESIEADRAALAGYRTGSTRWTNTALALAENLSILGDRTSNRDDLAEAVAICEAVLAAYPRERNAGIWAKAQKELGNALSALGDMNHDQAMVKRGGTALRAALSEFSLKNDPTEWASTTDGLARTYFTLGTMNSDAQYFQLAVDGYRDKLKVYTAKGNPNEWAMTKYAMGLSWQALSDYENRIDNLKNAIGCYREALSGMSREQNPYEWQEIQTSLDKALNVLNKAG